MRGPRVVERQQSHCKETDWPFCSDDDWVSRGLGEQGVLPCGTDSCRLTEWVLETFPRQR